MRGRTLSIKPEAHVVLGLETQIPLKSGAKPNDSVRLTLVSGEAGNGRECRAPGIVRADPVEDRERTQQRSEEPGIQSPVQFRTREEARV
jgi:hypothetical protein